MLSPREWLFGLRAFLQRRQRDEELDDELAQHLAFEVESLVAQGVAPLEARRRAAVAFGSVTSTKEQVHEASTWAWWSDLRRDVHYGVYALRREPGLTVAIVSTIAVSIAALTATFAIIDGLYLHPLPYRAQERLSRVESISPQGYRPEDVPVEMAAVLQRDTLDFARVALFLEGVDPGAEIGRRRGVGFSAVDSGTFALLGVQARRGRTFTADEFRSDTAVAIISDSLWHEAFNRDSKVLNRSLRLSGRDFRIVGVLPPGVRFYRKSDVWIALRPSMVRADISDSTHPGELERRMVRVAVERREGISDVAATAGAQHVVDAASRDTDLHLARWRVAVRPTLVARDDTRQLTVSLLVFIAPILLLLIGCSNVANLLLARASYRYGELALRASLGASPGRLLRQMLAEHALMAAIAAGVAVPLSSIGLRLILYPLPRQGLPSWVVFEVNWHVLGFLVLATAVSILLFGIAPARASAIAAPIEAMKSAGSRSTTSRRQAASGRRGIVLQLALTVVLVVAAFVTLRSYRVLNSVDVGYPEELVIPVTLRPAPALIIGSADSSRYPVSLFTSLRADTRIADVGVRAGFAGFPEAVIDGRSRLPSLAVTETDRRYFESQGSALAPLSSSLDAANPAIWVVDSSFFSSYATRAIAGRTFTSADSLHATGAAVVNAAFAQLAWGSGTPIGKVVQFGQHGTPLRIVGVVANPPRPAFGRQGVGATPRPEVYVSADQALAQGITLIVRGQRDSLATRAAIVSAMNRIDPSLPIPPLRSAATERDASFVGLRMLGGLIGALAIVGGVIAIIGLYGLVSYNVARRTRELGVRMALGATPTNIHQLVLGDGWPMLAIGLALGSGLSVLAMLTTRAWIPLSAAQCLGIVALVIAVLAVVGVLATLAPTRQVVRREPAHALRVD